MSGENLNAYDGLDPYQTIVAGNFSIPLDYANIIILIDEASNYDLSVFENDLNNFNSVAEHWIQVVIFGITEGDYQDPPDSIFEGTITSPTLVIGDVIEDINQYITGNYDFDKFYYVHSSRPPTLELLKEHAIPVTTPQNKFYFFIDSSGSMDRSSLEPTFSDYMTWVQNKIPSAEINIFEPTDERWIDWARQGAEGL